MAKKMPQISPAETEVLRLVWETGPATVREICDRLPAERNIAYATVQTLLRRLEKKGCVRHETRGKAHVFSSALSPEQIIGSEVGSFIDKLFGGDALPLVSFLAKSGKLNSDDIKKLENIIDNTETN